MSLHRRAFMGVATAVLASPAVLRAAEPLKLRCSLDTAPSHPRNVALVDYMAKLAKASNGEIAGEVFHSGQLFADLNVSKALLQGQVEMAAPGAWVLTGLVPDCDMIQMPYFYGVPIDVTHKVTDGKAGQFINQQLEAKLKTHVLGPWIDLGFQSWYSTRTPLDSFAALKGLKIRSPGGAAISWRIKFAGGIPQVGKMFWDKLQPAQQKLMTDVWAANIADYRKIGLTSQGKARKILEANGVKFHDPDEAEQGPIRKAMMADLPTLIKDAKLSPEIVKLVKESL